LPPRAALAPRLHTALLLGFQFLLNAPSLCSLRQLVRRISVSRILAIAAAIVCVMDPWALLAPGFWLSFGAVAAMVYAAQLSAAKSTMSTAFVAQAAVTLIMAPVLLLLFQEISLVSPIANACAIPIVSWLVVPLALAGAFFDWSAFLNIAAMIFNGVYAALAWIGSSPHAAWQSHAPVMWTVPVAIAGTALLFLPRRFAFKWFGILWWLPALLIEPAKPAVGQAHIDVLDVGQGLALVIRTTNHALVYDAGPSYSPDRDAGQRLVVPHLRAEGIRKLDKLVITHDDDDHFGGAVSVLTARKPDELLSSLPVSHKAHQSAQVSRLCESGQQWQWDGVKFIVHWPDGDAYETGVKKDNDLGCVIEVQTASHSMLLTADIERRSEATLVTQLGGALRADVLLSPHHGSKTSSTEAFLDVVQPDIVVISSGYRNRFRHPHPDVMARYDERGIAVHNTSEAGAVRIVLPASVHQSVEVTRTRDTSRRYWRDEVVRASQTNEATD
jgi:competence protein ComEC